MRLAMLLATPVVLLSAVACAVFIPEPPAQFTNRSQLPSCGEEARGQRDGPDVAARECLLSAFEDQRLAELVSTRPTVEGDPVTVYYRVWPTQAVPVEVYYDSSRDRFRSASWTYNACVSVVEVEGPEVFDLGGCPQRPQVLVQ